MTEKTEKFMETKIDENDLDTELSEQASRFLFAAQKHAQAQARHDALKLERDIIVAKIAEELRFAAEKDKRKISEAFIDKQINLDERYQNIRSQIIKSRVQRDYMRATERAMFQRKDMLIQMAISRRGELETMVSDSVKGASEEYCIA